MNMAINYAAYIAYVQSEDEEYRKAKETGQMEALEYARFIEELKEQSVSARG